jgi:hypothetical protein
MISKYNTERPLFIAGKEIELQEGLIVQLFLK